MAQACGVPAVSVYAFNSKWKSFFQYKTMIFIYPSSPSLPFPTKIQKKNYAEKWQHGSLVSKVLYYDDLGLNS